MGVIRDNRTSIVAGGLISASYVSDVYNVLTANAVEDIVLSGSLGVSGSLDLTGASTLTGLITIATASITNLTLTNASSSLIPFSDEVFDLGSSAKEWKDLYLDGTANIDLGLIDSASIGVVSSSLIPDADDTYDLGSSAKEWKDLYLDGTSNMDIVSSSNVHISAAGTASLHVSGGSAAATDIIFENLPTTKPIITGSLWLSGSAGNSSKYLVVFTG
jgi:hypothetical protein|tara:strand:- start:296 stop:949 length:654 start_codon:yes stop_codon:yes gene_type:complete